ncbi:MAG: diaminopimelate epimerase [Bacteroidales bacterium]|jgi:diaminopimelate epimerase|nr:diaminopimelate epimerase [Bacteroidales bacterium]MDY0198099.1 diaminopimelate epimerase [Tenuifilaceae bacterium]
MVIPFSKYNGAGKEFILIDNRTTKLNLTSQQIVQLCHRQLGIGADGIMLLEKDSSADFRLRNYNSDGNEGNLCGNGGRCIVKFAELLGIIANKATFTGIDGDHEAIVIDENTVRLKMKQVDEIINSDDYYIINTGSYHYVQFVVETDYIDVNYQGKVISDLYQTQYGAVDVSFAQYTPDGIKVRTYEHRVKAETLASGSGAIATAIAANHWFKEKHNTYSIIALGGILKVSFDKISDSQYHNVWSEGPVSHIFDGSINLG